MICPHCVNRMIEDKPNNWICSSCGERVEQLTLVGVDAMIFNIKIEPMGAVRMTRAGKFTSERAQKYLAYKESVAIIVNNQMRGKRLEGPIKIKSVKFIMPIPKSWSKKKRKAAIGQPHKSKPDIDNLLKGLFDAVNKIVWLDDAQVYAIGEIIKIYGEEPGIEFVVEG